MANINREAQAREPIERTERTRMLATNLTVLLENRCLGHGTRAAGSMVQCAGCIVQPCTPPLPRRPSNFAETEEVSAVDEIRQPCPDVEIHPRRSSPP